MVRHSDQPRDAVHIKRQHDQRGDAHAQHLTMRPHDQAPYIDDGEHNCQSGELDVGRLRLRQDGRARDQASHQEEHRQERIAAEDVGNRKLVVAKPH